MNDLRTAAQQALEALEQFGLDNPHRSYELEHAVIAALKAALAQQADPTLTIERLRDALVASRIIDPAAVEDPDEYDDGVTLHRIEALHRRLTLRQKLGVLEMTTITLPRATVEQAMEAMLNFPDDISDAMFESITALKAALAQKHDPVAHSGWVLREVLFDNGEPIGHREPQHSPAALAQQAEPVEPVAWVASKDGRVIYDDASTDDGLLRVSGDFENDEQRISYAKQIVDKLNAASAQQKDPIDPGHDVDVLREHVRHLERRVRQLHAQQAEPVDPVAWTLTKTLTERKTTTNGFLWFSDPVNSSWTALYTAPPQRTMVPLTEEEIDKIFKHLCDTVGASCKTMARAVEKASWEKNHGQA